MAVFGPRRRTLVIPVETIERVATEVRSHGRVRRGNLGVGVQSVRVTGADGTPGLMVVSVDDKGPARRAGILQGDILLSIDGSPLRSARSLARLLPGTLIDSSARFDLVRAGESKSLEITIGESPGA
jgi:S1-C subfamily serine protease